MSNSEVPPETDLVDSLKPYGKYPWYPNNQSPAPYNWKFSVGEFYGCVCHRPLDELAPSRLGSIPGSDL